MNTARVSAGLALFVFVWTAAPAEAQYGRSRNGAARQRTKQPVSEETVLATFGGTVRGGDKKILTIEEEDGNTLLFHCSRKTKYFDGSKEIKSEGLKSGDHVSVEGKRAPDGTLDAVNVRLEHPKQDQPTREER